MSADLFGSRLARECQLDPLAGRMGPHLVRARGGWGGGAEALATAVVGLVVGADGYVFLVAIVLTSLFR